MGGHASKGTTLKVGIVPAVVCGLTSIGELNLTADQIDVTTLDSPDNYREFVSGFKDGGEVSFEGYFDPTDATGQVEIHKLFESGEQGPFVIEFPAAMKTKWGFDGIVTAVAIGGAELDGAIGFNATIKISGKPTLTITP